LFSAFLKGIKQLVDFIFGINNFLYKLFILIIPRAGCLFLTLSRHMSIELNVSQDVFCFEINKIYFFVWLVKFFLVISAVIRVQGLVSAAV
jgi:hypothetical protein